jgi:hypothetical protein
MAQSFGSWLKAQQHRDDAIGDLAQDFLLDIKRTPFKRPSDWSPTKLFWRMKARGASACVRCLLPRAEREWKASR